MLVFSSVLVNIFITKVNLTYNLNILRRTVRTPSMKLIGALVSSRILIIGYITSPTPPPAQLWLHRDQRYLLLQETRQTAAHCNTQLTNWLQTERREERWERSGLVRSLLRAGKDLESLYPEKWQYVYKDQVTGGGGRGEWWYPIHTTEKSLFVV